MNEARILKALLFVAQECGGLGPGQIDKWLGKLHKSGYLQDEQRTVGDCQLPYLAITDEGRAKL